ncbi:MAG: hypothetical protein JWP12_905 [Bacteroidetes bacterium]|nr:hypothetical protein [Bacteroidota bacterium]
MKKHLLKSILTCVILVCSAFAFAQTPTTGASGLVLVGKSTSYISLNWTSGNGAKRIVTCALATNGAVNPTNGTNYTASSTFGSGSYLGTGNYCVYNGTSYGCTVFGLAANTDYRFRVYEYNTSVGVPYYNVSSYPTIYEYTLATEPTTGPSSLTFSNVNTTTVTLTDVLGSGTYNLIAVRASSIYANTPVDGTDYGSSSAYGSGGNTAGTIPYSYVVYDGTGNVSNVSNLTAGTTYSAAAFTYNGYSGANNYNTSSYPATTFTTLAAEPTSGSNLISFTNITDNSMTVSWTIPASGGGTNRIVTCKAGTLNAALPVDATYYTPGPTFGTGSQLGTSGAYVVYNGTGNYVNVTGLSNTATYCFSVFEYNVATNTYNNTYNYNTSYYPSDYQQTLTNEPTVAPSGLTFSNITSSSARATWANGNGANRIVGVAAGRKQTGLAFDGTDDYVSIPNESTFDLNNMTIEAWIKVNAFTVSDQSVITKGNDGWSITRNGTGNSLKYSINTPFIFGGTITYSTYGNRSVNDGKWHHVAATYNGSQMILYIDGALDAYTTVSLTPYNSSYPVYIGSNAAVSGTNFNGQIDEVRIWNVANPYYTIKDYMNKTLVGNEYGLKGYWKLDDGYTSTSTAVNSSFTSGLNAQLFGFSSFAPATSFTGTSGWIHSGAVVNVPLDFSSYFDNTVFMTNTSTSYYYGNLYYTVYRGPDSTTVNVTGLSPNSYYTFGVFDYNGTSGNNNYLINNYAIGEVLTSAVTAPVITSFTPASGFIGSIVTINGSGFNATPANNTVYFGATKATVLTANAGGTVLTVKVPSGATFEPISVTNNTLTAYTTKPFNVTSPCGGSAFTATTLNAGTTATGYYPVSVRIADMDQDGLPDIVGLYQYGYTSITRNASTSTAVNLSNSPVYIYDGNATTADLDVADFDGDGRTDILVGNSYNSNGSFIVTRNTSTPGNISTAANVEFAGISGYTVSDVKVADFDKDGKPDVIMTYANNYMSYYRNTSSIGNITFATRTDLGVFSSAVFNSMAVGDIDGDGKIDVAFAEGTNSTIQVLRNTSSIGSISFVLSSVTLTGTITGVTIGDIDNDGKPEILYGASVSTIGILKNNSTPGTVSISTTPTTLTTLGYTPGNIKLGDLDGDGKADITVGYVSGSYVSIFKNNSTATISVATKNDFLVAGGSNPAVVAVADMNADSKMDVLSTTNGQNFSYFQNNINPLAAEPTVQASNLVFSAVTTTQMTVTFTPGNGANKVVFVRAASSPAFSPSDGVSYVPNTTFGSGTDLGGGTYCVFDGNGSGVTVNGLLSNTNYVFSVYEYNGLLTCQYNYMPNSGNNSATQATNNNPPTLNAISNPASICQSSGLQTVNLSGIGTGSGNETQTLTITATSSNTGLIPTPTVNYVSPAATGTLTYTPVAGVSGTSLITVTINDGATNNNILTRTFTVTVDHTPTVSIAGPNQQICPGVATLAGNTPAFGTGLWSIVSTTNGAISVTVPGNPTSTVTNFAIGDSATFRWTISNGSCATSSSVVKIKRNSCPTTADFTASSTTQCLSGTPVITYTDASIAAGATITSWSWNFGPGAFPATATGQGPHTVSYSTAGAKTVSLQVTDNLAATDFEIKTGFVTINDVPDPASNVSGSATVCQGQNGVTYSVPLINNASGYVWNLPSGASLISGINTNNITVDYGAGSISGNISVRGTNACGNGTLSANFPVTINPLPNSAGAISGATTVCDGATSVTYSVPSILNATSYSWSLPGGVTIIGATNTNSITVNYTNGLTGGVISVMGVNSCGNGVSNSITFTVNPYPGIAGTIVGQASITTCPSTSGVTYSIPLVSDASTYNWAVPTGASIVGGAGTNSITVDYSASAVSGNVTVMPANSCGNGTAASLPIIVNTLPTAAGVIAGSDTLTLCPASNSITYTVSPVFNASYYTWSLPAGATIVSGDSTNSITVNYSNAAASGNISVFGQNACGVGASSTLNVYVAPVPTQELCMVSVDTGSTYNIITWEKPMATDIDSFRIYREVLSSFVHIGSVPYDSLSEYADNVYLPAADPNTTNFRYKISVIDTCGNESALSNYHRTIFLQANQGVGGVINLNWVPYEGATVDFYRILRDTAGTGDFVPIDSVPGVNTVYTDVAPPASAANIGYLLESNWAVTCTPTRATVNTTRSNIKHVGLITTGNIEQDIMNAAINVYPNPASDEITVEYPVGFKKYTLMVFDALGQLVYNQELADEGSYKGTLTHKMDVSALTKGVYIVSVQTEYGSTFKRIVIQ